MSETEPPKKKLRPARKQVLPGQVDKKQEVQTGKEYNIWYNKWAGGDREDSYSNKVKSQTRCNVARDSGYTRAQTTGMKYCCLFFARGCCPYGFECEYLHVLPSAATQLPDTSKDCFAREKFSDYRDDMGGVGTFTRENRTLYVGRIKENGPGEETEEIVRRHFQEWGEIDRMRVLQHRGVAFVTYVSEYSAQFAKESMACQSLDNDEILNVRWATEDPNPTTKVIEKRRLEDIGKDAISNRMDPKIIDAVRQIRALEDGVILEPEEPDVYGAEEQQSEEDDQPPVKKQRIEKPGALLSSETMEGLRYYAELRKKQAASAKAKPAARVNPLALTAGYGSDSD
ncbi:hypothetical protein EXIGLDRAFT_676863 [Exidia glandulosa HHB12029]|uniref:Pre-mRNA-splicing factor CWC2 n=1 Tax=Exidia glandulosa HHB12029 TaxID=1314781 RepID=A0A165GIY0_EXIGL|nr:hypothetical protein EXIGLDRAFT_676863 [Exidia glandulosa HHB12029]